MKTFKLISLQILTKSNDYVEVELSDGLIINKEDDQSTWLIEAFIKEEILALFDDFNQDDELLVQAVITKKDNDPVSFKTTLRTVQTVDGHASILLEGHLRKTRSKYAELLLENLVDKGFDGQELLEEFKEKIRSRPKLSALNK
ncbi:YwpF family protein [Peribacillus sp. SCS-155]|uniref:YwpF family protein n=1 Tax=Peribacillus sedimenti TaxID=3115297 RepID=UPI003906162A